MARLSPTSSPNLPEKFFSVGVIGVGDSGLEIFRKIFEATRCHARCYEIIAINDVSAPESMGVLKEADIFLVNANNPQAVLAWRRFQTELPSEKRRPIFQLNQHVSPSVAAAGEFTICWPLNGVDLLAALDNYTFRYLDYPAESESLSLANTAISKRQPALEAPTDDVTWEASARYEKTCARVLVADDSLAVRRQLKIEFDSICTALECVADGDAAVAAANRQAFDLILLDVVMPGLDGYAACRLIRRTTFNKHTPIIMLTSRSSRFDRLKGVLAGCDSYLTKPVNHQEFKEIANKHLVEKPAV